jgi:hypothetical protein
MSCKVSYHCKETEMPAHHENLNTESRQGSTSSDQGTYIDLAPLIAKDRLNGSTTCLSLLASYAECLSLRDPELSSQAQLAFHKAQIARQVGGTMGHKLGHQLSAFLRQHCGASEVKK